MNWHNRQHNQGFTIVELLIIIVVIAILAAVTVVAFSGLQARATNSATLSTLNAFEKGLKSHMALTGKPLELLEPDRASYGIDSLVYYRGSVGMRAVCIGSSWPSPDEMAEEIQPGGEGYYHNLKNNNPDDIYSHYCSDWSANGYMVNAMKSSLESSPASASFPKMKNINSVKMTINNPYNGTAWKITVRGVRYAFNGSDESPISYLFYPVYGKTCMDKDVTISFGTANGTNIGPGQVFSGYTETGGDYTIDNSAYCMRTIRY